jgi:hypothetical protein
MTEDDALARAQREPAATDRPDRTKFAFVPLSGYDFAQEDEEVARAIEYARNGARLADILCARAEERVQAAEVRMSIAVAPRDQRVQKNAIQQARGDADKAYFARAVAYRSLEAALWWPKRVERAGAEGEFIRLRKGDDLHRRWLSQ